MRAVMPLPAAAISCLNSLNTACMNKETSRQSRAFCKSASRVWNAGSRPRSVEPSSRMASTRRSGAWHSCSYRPPSTALRARQNSTSAIGPGARASPLAPLCQARFCEA